MLGEPAIAITVVCAARLRPLMKTIFPSSWRSAPRKSSGASHGIHLGRMIMQRSSGKGGSGSNETYESLDEVPVSLSKSTGSFKSGITGDEKPLVGN